MLIDDELFPFRFRLDHNSLVTQMGPSLQKIVGNSRVGCKASRIVRTARGDWEPTYEELQAGYASPPQMVPAMPYPMMPTPPLPGYGRAWPIW